MRERCRTNELMMPWKIMDKPVIYGDSLSGRALSASPPPTAEYLFQQPRHAFDCATSPAPKSGVPIGLATWQRQDPLAQAWFME